MVGGGGGYGVVVVEGQVEERNEAEDADFKGKNEGKNPRLGVALSSPNQISPDDEQFHHVLPDIPAFVLDSHTPTASVFFLAN